MFRRLALPVLAAGSLALTACGGSAGSADSPYAAFIEGVESASQQDTVQFTLESSSSVSGQEITVTGEGVQSLDGSAAEIDVSTSFAGQAFEVQTILLDQIIYLNSPQLAQMTGSEAWIEIDPAEMEEAAGFDLSQFTESAQQAQSSFDQMLGMVEDSFEEIGEEEVNGIATTHYAGTVDTSLITDMLDGSNENMAAVLESLPETYDMEVWLDGDNLPRRVLTDLDITAEGQTVATTSTIEFLEYGVELDVEAPTDTVSFSEMMGGLGG